MFSASVPGRDMEQPVPQRFRLGLCQIIFQGEGPEPGHEVSGDHRQRQPRLVDAELAGGKRSQAAAPARSRPW